MLAESTPAELGRLNFDNRFALALPADPESDNFRRQVASACYSRVMPTPVSEPRLVAWSPEAAALLDLPSEVDESDLFAEVFAGNRLLEGMDPIATCYGGHQFGNWAGQLGDGRAINLGEVLNRRGERWTVQLKGAGPTPYSRTADGLAVLRSSLREFVCSEAMFHLGVPTTRALSLVLTGDEVVRDILYDGHPAAEPGAVVCRIAPSFTRFGHFEILASRQEKDLLRRLVDFTIETDFPELADEREAKKRALAWFAEVSERTADMIVHWMRVGFVHGVMNTDNMSVLGLTIDYGPYGWLEGYDPTWTPNTTDASTRRYRFGAQPAVAQWNLLQLAKAIYPLIEDADPLNEVLNGFAARYTRGSEAMVAAKLGLREYLPSDEQLSSELFELMGAAETDMTLFFRNLADVDLENPGMDPLVDAYYEPAALSPALRERTEAWLGTYAQRVRAENWPERVARMNATNPRFVPRNYLAQLAIDEAERGEFALLGELMDVLRRPYDEQPGRERFAEKRPEWARHRAGCSMLSCSS
ncbi:MAG: YdiU family protein [Gammaproteobacteria bacterium]|nr:YdiU family protein [Gammaproteobacteria bacterium]